MNVEPQRSKKKDEIKQLALSNRCVETAAQIQQVLQVIGLTASALQGGMHRPFNMYKEDEEAETRPLKMTEGQIALEKTLWAACDRMEKILGEDARWSDEFQRKVEKDYDELHKLQMEAIEKQRAAAAEVTSPHFRYRPDLKRLRDGRWLAILGDDQHLEFAIYGIGNSAQLALEEFDSVFLRGVPASVLRWAANREAAFEAGLNHTEAFPNQDQIHEKNTDDDNEKMDDSGNSTGGGTSPGR